MWTSIRSRARALFQRRKLEQDIQDELAFHLAMKAEKLDDADAARRRFGNEARIKEDVRDAWMFGWVESLCLDVRHAARAVARTPGFAAIAVLSLTIGIGANTAIFTVLHEFFLKSLPVKEPDRLRVLTWTGEGKSPAKSINGYSMLVKGTKVTSSFSSFAFEEIKSRASAFQAVGGFTEAYPNVVIRGQAAVATGMIVTSGFFDALGARARIGRTLVESDMRPEAPPVAVISWSLCQRAFGGDGSALGSIIDVNRTATTVIGILPPGVIGLTRAFPVDVYLPMARRGELAAEEHRWRADSWWIQAIGRLRPGVADEVARAQVDAVLQSATTASMDVAGEKFDTPTAVLQEGRTGLSFLYQSNETFLQTLLAMVIVVLLIACANVTNLLLARSGARAREFAVRQSLGAGRIRIIRHLLTETLLIAGTGGLLGFGLAQLGTRALVWVVAPNPHAHVEVQPDSFVLVLTMVLTILTALITGVMPAVRASSVQPAGSLKQGGAAAGATRQRLSRGLVAMQVALAVVLLAGAGMFGRTLHNLNSIETGIKADNLLLFFVNGRVNGYEGERLIRLYERVYEKIAALPGVHSVTHSKYAVLSGSMSRGGITVPGYTEKDASAWVHEAGDRFLTVMGVPILLGRDLQPTDHEKAPRVAVINETMARKYFGGNALGREFAFGGQIKDAVRVVGIAADAKYDRLTSEIAPTAYLPWRQNPRIAGANFEVRTSVAPLSLASAVRRAVAEIDPTLPVSNVRTQRQQIDRTIARERTFATLGALFSGIAVLLACIGIYGVLAYSVTRRRSEFGVRLALGATPRGIAWLVVSGLVTPVGVALLIGLPVSVGAFRLVEASLYGVTPGDPLTLAGSVAAILAAALVAALVPSRRAAKCDPAIALRYE